MYQESQKSLANSHLHSEPLKVLLSYMQRSLDAELLPGTTYLKQVH